MFFKNLKYAFRNLRRDKFYTFLNGVGLTIGLTVAMLIFMWVQDETSYDNYHSQNGQNYFVLSNSSFAGERDYGMRTPATLAESAKDQIPEVQQIARAYSLWKSVLEFENFLFSAKNGYLVDPSILKILDFEFVKGNPDQALSDPKSIVISESVAFKIFGNENPIGKTITVQDKLQLQVTGTIKDTPVNTHFPVDFFIPFEGNKMSFLNEGGLHWGAYNFNTYVLLRPNSDPEKVSKQLTGLLPEKRRTGKDQAFFELHPINDIHLGLEKLKYGFPSKGDWKVVQLFGLIGFIILLIASINYINLTTARAGHQAKATGIRKIIGASKSQLISQHILETFCLVSICSFVALLLVQGSLPFFEEISGKEFSHNTVFTKNTLLLFGGMTVLTVLLSGIQPAFQLSAFHPLAALRKNGGNKISRKFNLRKTLVVAQFFCSAVLIICTAFMLRQMDFVQSSKLGYEKEHIFSFYQTHDNPNIFLESLKGKPGIEDVSMSSSNIVSITNQLGGFTWEGMEGEQDLSLNNIYVGEHFKDFFNLTLKEGRWFNPGRLDSASFVINEATAELLQLDNPVGKWIDFWGSRGTIVGVTKDFHFQSLHKKIEPLIFLQNQNYFPTIYVKTTGEKASQAIASAQTVFKQHQPKAVFKYEFLDDSYNALYKSESRIGQLFMFFAFIAIIISCLGIFGLATYTAEKRFKEIGIRKVLGASVISIVQLLSKDFVKLVIVALIFATPISWYFMSSWLNTFAYRVELDWWIFALAGLGAIVIALLTVGIQSVRAAVANPAESIKSE